jgi:hypothetical protein
MFQRQHEPSLPQTLLKLPKLWSSFAACCINIGIISKKTCTSNIRFRGIIYICTHTLAYIYIYIAQCGGKNGSFGKTRTYVLFWTLGNCVVLGRKHSVDHSKEGVDVNCYEESQMLYCCRYIMTWELLRVGKVDKIILTQILYSRKRNKNHANGIIMLSASLCVLSVVRQRLLN